MAKIVIAGDAVVVTSAMKLEDLRTIAKYRPDALVLRGGEDGKEPIFAVSVTENGCGGINRYGATFGSESRTGDNLASLTMYVHAADSDIREYIADKIGTAIINLTKLEETLPSVLEEIKEQRAAVMDNIVVAQ